MAYITIDKKHIPLTWRILLFVMANDKFYTGDLLGLSGIKFNTAQNYTSELKRIGIIHKQGKKTACHRGYLWIVNRKKLAQLLSEFRLERM